MKRFAFFIVITILISRSIYAEVDHVVFITSPKTILLSATSTTITIQSQNSKGEKEDVVETSDVIFTSTSPTGKFLSVSGGKVSETMSKNTANKNFLYTDLTAGSYKITVELKGRNSSKILSVSQEIIVKSANPPVISNTTHSSSTPNLIQAPKSKRVTNVPSAKPSTTTEPIKIKEEEKPGTNTVTIFVAPQKKYLANSLFSWPNKLFHFIRHIFVED